MDDACDMIKVYEGYYWGIERPKRKEMLLSMYDNPMTPKSISKAMGYKTGSVTMLIRTLKKKGLIFCLNEEAKRYRLYTLTPLGERVVELIMENEE